MAVLTPANADGRLVAAGGFAGRKQGIGTKSATAPANLVSVRAPFHGNHRLGFVPTATRPRRDSQVGKPTSRHRARERRRSDEAEACADDHEDTQSEENCEHRVIQEGERGAHPRNRGMWAGTARLNDTRARRAAMVASPPRMLRIARMSQQDALVTEKAL